MVAGYARSALDTNIQQNTYELYTKYIRCIQNGWIKKALPLGATSQPPKGMLPSLAFFRQPICMHWIYFVYISYVFCYILVSLLYSTPPRAKPPLCSHPKIQTSIQAVVVLVPTSSKNARNGHRSEFMGWKLDRSSKKLNARLFWLDEIQKTYTNWLNNCKNVICRNSVFWEATGATPKLEKNNLSDII